MKFYNQSGTEFQRTHLAVSDNICACCQSYDHQAAEYYLDDAVCDECGQLCRCACHREK